MLGVAVVRKISFAIIIVVVFGLSGLFLARERRDAGTAHSVGSVQRIISLSPSLTETLYALGLGDRVVGVTKFCLYPSEAQTKAIVGSLYDHNYELIMQLKPDVVVLNGDQSRAQAQFEHMGIPVLLVENRTIAEVFDMIQILGQTFGKDDEARMLVADMQRQLERYRALAATLPRARALVCVGRSMGGASVTQAYAVGPQTYAGALLTYAGGENVYQGVAAYPILTSEALIRLNPDVIIELVPEVGRENLTVADIVAQWANLPEIAAVRNGRVHVLTEGYTVLPGPRLVLLLEDFMRALYPGTEEKSNE